jgi:hypothetical protein
MQIIFGISEMSIKEFKMWLFSINQEWQSSSGVGLVSKPF